MARYVTYPHTVGRRLDPHALVCREFGHPLNPFRFDGEDSPFYECAWCGEYDYEPLPYLVQPLRAAWEVAAVAGHMVLAATRTVRGWFLTEGDDGIPF
jgi:hypothetical protein